MNKFWLKFSTESCSLFTARHFIGLIVVPLIERVVIDAASL